MYLTHCHGIGLKGWPFCWQGHAKLSQSPKSRPPWQLRRKPLLKFYQPLVRVRPASAALTSSVLTGRSYALDLESGRLYKTEVMNRSVAEIREDLAARNADTRGIKKVIAERLFSLLQDEAEKLKQSRRAAAASPAVTVRPKAPPRPRRTPAQMAEKLQLRSTSEPAKRAKRALVKDRAPPGPRPAPGQLPGTKAAQMVRLAMMSKIAQAAMVSAQQKQQQAAAEQTETDPPKRAKRGRPPKAKHAQQAQHDAAQQGERGATEVAWESAVPSSSSSTQSLQGAVYLENSAAESQSTFSNQDSAGTAQDNSPQNNHSVAIAAASGASPGQVGPSPALTKAEEHPAAAQPDTSHTADLSMHASSAADLAPMTREGVQPEAEEWSLLQRRDSHGNATTSDAAQSISNNTSSSISSTMLQGVGSKAAVGSDARVVSDARVGPNPTAGSEARVGSEGRSSYNSSTIWKASSSDQEVVNSNASGMQISFLGTASSVDCRSRSPNCIAVRAQKAVMLFDCGEDAQRQLLKQPQIVHGKINRLFVTDLSSTNIYGIPGMLCTLSWARERGFENADIPLHVYGPPGLADYIRTMLLLSDTYSMVPILVHEFQPHACSQEPEMILQRARLYRVLLPPDQLNSFGYYDGTLDAAFLSRYDRKKKGGRADLRASTKQMTMPPPGDPALQGLQTQDMSWTISCDQETVVTSFSLPGSPPGRACFGYALQEADRAGNLDVVKAQQLGVFPGPAYGALKAGDSVQAEDGTWVTPQQVVGPDQPGRRVVILGQTSNPMPSIKWAQAADSVMPGPPPQGEDSSLQAVPGAADYAAFVQAINAAQILLTRLNDTLDTDAAVRSVQMLCSGQTDVQAAYDHMVMCLERRKP